jgi:hypothetical protein
VRCRGLGGNAGGFRHHGFLGGCVPGCSSEDYFAGLARPDGEIQCVINPGMTFFRLGGFPNIRHLEVGAKHIIPAFVLCRFHSKDLVRCVSGCVVLLDAGLMRRTDQFNRPYFSATHELVRRLV